MPLEHRLTQLATSRLTHAFSDSTKKAYNTLFRTFLAFVVFMTWNVHQVTTLNLLCFLECLQYNGVKYTQMANYLSAIRTKFIILGLDVACLNDSQLKYYQKAVQLQSPLNVQLKKIIDIPLLESIVKLCDFTYMGQVFKAVYLLSFFSFLRLSNLVPHAIAQFSPLKHLAQGDLIFRPDKVVIIIKWSKTMQTKNDIKLITVPRIFNSILCPVTALSNLLALTPRARNFPLFQVKVHQTWLPLTDTKVRRHFLLLLTKLKLHNSGYTFHTFRPSGATFAFNNNVDLQNIQKHGTWTSDCVWRYITDTVDAGQQVANMFKQKLSGL